MALSSLGAVVVPLNFQLTSREIAYIVKDSEMTHLVSMETLDLSAELAPSRLRKRSTTTDYRGLCRRDCR